MTRVLLYSVSVERTRSFVKTDEVNKYAFYEVFGHAVAEFDPRRTTLHEISNF